MNRTVRPCLLVLAACAALLRPVAPQAAVAPATVPGNPAACRVGPDGARPIADRGIGGTGAPQTQTTERGIGGTGAPQIRSTDRGIGGTGIIGVITGFASVCVAGEEVALPPTLPARIDGGTGTLDDLRAGQVVAVQAVPSTEAGPSLLAREIVVRHAVIGPVQAVGNGTITVAGQQVLLADAAGQATHARPGESVAVSGLRRPGGVIEATRIDPAPPGGPVLLRGELVRSYGTARIGAQVVRLPPDSTVPSGFPVVVTGRMERGVLLADSVMRDEAEDSPAAYFGPSVTNFVVEGYWSAAAGGYFVRRDFVRGGFRLGVQGRGIAVFRRNSGGGFTAGPVPYEGGGRVNPGGPSYTPAPMPRGGGGFNAPLGPGGDFGGPGDRFRPQGPQPRGGRR